MINFSRVFKTYSANQDALKDVSFELEAGEMAFLTGHSGAGKSTLLRLIIRLELASKGSVFINNQDLARLSTNQIPYLRRKMGVVFQDHQLLFDRSVYDNVALPLVISDMKPKEIQSRVRAALDKVGLLTKEKHTPIMLSGGEQQRVGIARAVVNKPEILLADEPTGNLDPLLSAEIMQLFRQFNALGTTVLIASHDLALVRAMNKRVIALKNGEKVYDGVLKR